ncbi:MAG: hypothetical protein SGI72_15110 [Planctomycetota bacterium]|nr:hypothetical protein [Planctomycetota bacterium]
MILASLALVIAQSEIPSAELKHEEFPAVKATLSVDEARSAIARGVAWLLANQRADGAWGTRTLELIQLEFFSVETHYSFQIGANALAVRALLSVEETPERRAALDKGLRWLCTTEMSKRGSDWDVDCSWSAVCGFDACVEAAMDPRFKEGELRQLIDARGKEFYALLEKNQEPLGGWGYYEGPVTSRRPTWSTSFTTALVVPALFHANALGWGVDPKIGERARRYVGDCALPNGAYEYDLNPIPRIRGGEGINDVKGSLGRIQICNWARRQAGDKVVTDEKIRQGLELFFEHHKFLDVARLKPVPHEAYYQNAAYFYLFAHCFAARAINELPADERESFHARLRPHLAKVQSVDGQSFDFLGSTFMTTSGTAFAILALQAGVSK